MVVTIILFLVGFVLITKGADIFINCTVDIGKKTNISELVLGATIVSFATTLPELTVSLCASFNNQTTMSFGNAVGSIICNTGLILGLVAFISPFKVDKKMFQSKSTILLASILVLIIIGLDGKVGGKDSIILLAILAVFMYTNYKSVVTRNTAKVDLQKSYSHNTNKQGFSSKELIKILVLFFAGLLMMVLGSKLLVDNGSEIAKVLGVPEGIVSLTVIALGTSLPELVSSLTAIRKKHHAISVGNVLGANILNITSVISLASIPNDIPILSQNATIDYPFMIALILILILPTLKNNKLYRFQGLFLLLTYASYIATLYVMYM